MAELATLVYGNALLEIGMEESCLDKLLDEAKLVKSVFEENPDFYDYYVSPQVSREVKKETLVEIFGDNISEEIKNFLFILLDKKRTSDCLKIIAGFEKLANEQKNIVEGILYTATPCSEEQKALIENRLSELSGKSIRLRAEIDEAVIGGIKVKIGDNIVDATVQKQLKDLKSTIDSNII